MNLRERQLSAIDFLAHLASTGVLSPEGAERATHAFRSTGHPLDVVVTELGLLREDDLAREMGGFLNVTVPAALPKLDRELVDAAGLAFLEDHALLPLSRGEGDILELAVCDPFSRAAIEALAFHFDRVPLFRIATRSAILGHLKSARDDDPPDADSDRAAGTGTQPDQDDIERLRDIAREAPVVRFVSRIIGEAVEKGATDIHVEPREDTVQIRLRLDGMLVPVETLPWAMHAGIVTRIKILAQLNIAERRLPQDGRMRAVVRGQNIDLRVSVVPSAHGETVVLRILDRSRVRLELGALGFDDGARHNLTRMAHAANGIVLITGPTGSGKTTTLYALLKELNSSDTKIFTVEDPIEYRLTGLTQLQVEPAIDLDFAAALRAVLRQDPDVILVGEIRDRETAEIAVRASLTGHLVLSTLHTNSAASAFTRLRDIGIDNYLLGATVRGVVGQRLLRCVCPQCQGKDARLRSKADACPICHGSGYSARTVAYELLTVSEGIAGLIHANARDDEIKLAAVREGMVPLADHVRGLVENGVTTVEEARRVIDLGGA